MSFSNDFDYLFDYIFCQLSHYYPPYLDENITLLSYLFYNFCKYALVFLEITNIFPWIFYLLQNFLSFVQISFIYLFENFTFSPGCNKFERLCMEEKMLVQKYNLREGLYYLWKYRHRCTTCKEDKRLT